MDHHSTLGNTDVKLPVTINLEEYTWYYLLYLHLLRMIPFIISAYYFSTFDSSILMTIWLIIYYTHRHWFFFGIISGLFTFSYNNLVTDIHVGTGSFLNCTISSVLFFPIPQIAILVDFLFIRMKKKKVIKIKKKNVIDELQDEQLAQLLREAKGDSIIEREDNPKDK